MSATPSFANAEVLEFYKTLPFNYRETVEGSVRAIKETDQLSAYPVLKALLKPGVTVLDVGCGAGWLSNAMAFRQGATVTGIDFNPVAVARAQEVAGAMNLPIKFSVEDLFLYEPAELFDVAVSIGVLHHTNDCHAAIRRILSHCVKPGGHVFIGLYHTHGRKPLLDHFEEMKRRGASEDEMLDLYRELHSQLKDDVHLKSWFRDQVLHPHETQHTLEEMVPLLREEGFSLVSTSINKFGPIGSLEDLYAEEKRYHDIAVQRLKENQYFTGFFVFLARNDGGAPTVGDSQTDASGQFRDTKRYIEHHPRYGYHYTPHANYALPRPGGGTYRLTVNSEGIRSDREYSFVKPPGVTRIVLCGDSMTAGQYVPNSQRVSELLERRFPHLEIVNLALEGSGTDQQLLIYEDLGLKFEHDLVMVLPFLQNIRRNMAKARISYDPETREPVLLPKPWFELEGGNLALHGVPVPKERTKVPSGMEGEADGTDERSGLMFRVKSTVNRWAIGGAIKKILYRLKPWEPFPEFKSAETQPWRLMEAILKRFKELAGTRPVLIVPLFYESYVRYPMARNYWDRFASLENSPGVQVLDVLPHFKKLGAEASKCFQEPLDCHFSAYGHLALADALEQELRARKFLGPVT